MTRKTESSQNETGWNKTGTALPSLDVFQGIYCSQSDTDKVLGYLQTSRPDLIQHFFDTAELDIDFDYKHGFGEVVKYLRSSQANLHIPETRIGMLDVIFELHRRVQKGLNKPVPIPKGKPISADIRSKLPPLLRLPIPALKLNAESSLPGLPPGFYVSQELVDAALELVYTRRPDIFFELAESMRRDITADETYKEFMKVLVEIGNEVSILPRQRPKLLSQAMRRMAAMCEIRGNLTS